MKFYRSKFLTFVDSVFYSRRHVERHSTRQLLNYPWSFPPCPDLLRSSVSRVSALGMTVAIELREHYWMLENAQLPNFLGVTIGSKYSSRQDS